MSCLEVCRSLGYDDAIEYGISVKYARTRQWGVWEVFREFMQNALDEEHYVRGTVPREYLCRTEPGKTIIYDHGRGISIDNLLLGESRKEKWQRGMFGEGMKIAMIAALLQGLRVRIRSKDKEIVPITIKKVFEEYPVEVLCACIKKDLPQITGTQVVIEGAELCFTFSDRVVQGILSRWGSEYVPVHLEDPERKIWYDVISPVASPDSESSIYVRDLYIAKVKEVFPETLGALYSYNLYDVKLDESRKIPSTGSVYNDLGYLMGSLIYYAQEYKEVDRVVRDVISRSVYICVEKWQRLAIDKVNLEATVYPVPLFLKDKHKEYIKKVFEELFGPDAVIVDSIERFEMARYLGLNPLYCRESLANFLISVIDVNKKMIEKQMGYMKKVVDVEKEMPRFANLINILLEMAKLVIPEELRDATIKFAVLDPDKYGQTTSDKVVLVNINNLLSDCEREIYRCVESWMSVLIHEFGHLWCLVKDGKMCDDTTPEFIYGITTVAGKVSYRIVSYSAKFKSLLDEMWNEYRNLGWR